MARRNLFLASAVALGVHAQNIDQAEFFETRIRPLLAKNCFSCHSQTVLGGLRLDSRDHILRGGNSGPAIRAGEPDKSLLIQTVSHTHERLKMPLGANRLPLEEIENLKVWVRLGAFWPEKSASVSPPASGKGYVIRPEQREFWSFKPVRKPAIPPVANSAWPKGPIDRFILAKLEAEGLKPAEAAEKRALIRRASFDLTGLPPAPEQVDAFLADRTPDAFAKVVDRLLTSPHYGERWGRYWLDLARYSDSVGATDGIATFSANAFRYRDWVVQAFNEDMRYDRFIKSQLAADLFPPKEREALLPALGFHALGPPAEDDRVDITTRTFLALTVGCAKCPDHKFDPIPTLDYYSLQGVFKSSERHEYPLAPPDAVSAYRKVQQQIKDKEEAIAAFVQKQRELLADILIDQTASYMVAAWKRMSGAKNEMPDAGLDGLTLRRWIRYLGNREREHPFLNEWDELIKQDATLERAQAFASKFQQLVASVNQEKRQIDDRNYIKLGGAAGFKDKKIRDTVNIEFLEPKKWSLWRDIAGDPCNTGGCQCGLPFDGGIVFYGDEGDEHHGYYKLAQEEKIDRFLTGEWKAHLDKMRAELRILQKSLPAPYPFLHCYRDSDQPADVPVAIRGDERNQGEIAPRRFLQILSGGEPKRFSQGSGRLGLAEAIASPDNPLTARVMVNRLWHYHFGQGIVRTVSNFGRLGERPSHPELLDYLAMRFIESGWSLKALHREMMLSATYAMSTAHDASNFEKDPDNRLLWRANLTPRLDAESLRDAILYVAGSLDQGVGGPPAKLTDENRRRVLYTAVTRTDVDRALLLFDFPDPNAVPETRAVTVGPLQRLYFLNSGFVIKQAGRLAARLQQEAPGGDEQKIRRAYQLLFSRPPNDREIALGTAFLHKSGTSLNEYAQVLLASSEFSSVN